MPLGAVSLLLGNSLNHIVGDRFHYIPVVSRLQSHYTLLNPIKSLRQWWWNPKKVHLSWWLHHANPVMSRYYSHGYNSIFWLDQIPINHDLSRWNLDNNYIAQIPSLDDELPSTSAFLQIDGSPMIRIPWSYQGFYHPMIRIRRS